MNNSFTYTIASDERINSGANQIYFDIDIGFNNSDANDFLVEVLNITVSSGIPSALGYIIMTAVGFADNGQFCQSKLSANECIVAIIPSHAGNYIPLNGTVTFVTKNTRMKKRVRFRMLKSDLTPVANAQDINFGGETKWLLTLRVTPL